jgi:hypothetical protein
MSSQSVMTSPDIRSSFRAEAVHGIRDRCFDCLETDRNDCYDDCRYACYNKHNGTNRNSVIVFLKPAC